MFNVDLYKNNIEKTKNVNANDLDFTIKISKYLENIFQLDTIFIVKILEKYRQNKDDIIDFIFSTETNYKKNFNLCKNFLDTTTLLILLLLIINLNKSNDNFIKQLDCQLAYIIGCQKFLDLNIFNDYFLSKLLAKIIQETVLENLVFLDKLINIYSINNKLDILKQFSFDGQDFLMLLLKGKRYEMIKEIINAKDIYNIINTKTTEERFLTECYNKKWTHTQYFLNHNKFENNLKLNFLSNLLGDIINLKGEESKLLDLLFFILNKLNIFIIKHKNNKQIIKEINFSINSIILVNNSNKILTTADCLIHLNNIINNYFGNKSNMQINREKIIKETTKILSINTENSTIEGLKLNTLEDELKIKATYNINQLKNGNILSRHDILNILDINNTRNYDNFINIYNEFEKYINNGINLYSFKKGLEFSLTTEFKKDEFVLEDMLFKPYSVLRDILIIKKNFNIKKDKTKFKILQKEYYNKLNNNKILNFIIFIIKNNSILDSIDIDLTKNIILYILTGCHSKVIISGKKDIVQKLFNRLFKQTSKLYTIKYKLLYKNGRYMENKLNIFKQIMKILTFQFDHIIDFNINEENNDKTKIYLHRIFQHSGTEAFMFDVNNKRKNTIHIQTNAMLFWLTIKNLIKDKNLLENKEINNICIDYIDFMLKESFNEQTYTLDYKKIDNNLIYSFYEKGLCSNSEVIPLLKEINIITIKLIIDEIFDINVSMLYKALSVVITDDFELKLTNFDTYWDEFITPMSFL